MKPLWTLADLIDLHFFFQSDEALRLRLGEEALAKRDRIIFLAKIEPQLGKAEAIPPRLLVRKWLENRRLQYLQEKGQGGQVLPGAVWRELTALCRGLFFFIGLLAGIGLAQSFLLYSGAVALNVSSYLGLFVGLQVLILTLQGVFLLYRWLRRIPMESTLLYLLLGRLLLKGVDGVRRRLQRKMTGRQRLDLAGLAGAIHQRRELAALLIWPVFLLMQLAGVGFNLGVLGATLAKVAFADIAFGWQSSLQLSAGAVARLVHGLALPWSWALPQASPSLAQIEGSQMVLKEGVAHLATGALVSWWPFLCLAVAIYGLLPRLALLVLGLVQQRRALERLHFATLGIQPLLERMAAPRVDTRGVSAAPAGCPSSSPFSPVDPGEPPAGLTSPLAAVEGQAPCWLLIPEELEQDCPRALLLDLLRPRTGAAPIHWFCLSWPGPAEVERLAGLTGGAEPAGVLLLQEAWQPPLQETLTFLAQLRRVLGRAVPLTVVLIGRPSATTPFTPVIAEQLQIWSQKLRASGDPGLRVLPLVQP